jgi:hypothetical protein
MKNTITIAIIFIMSILLAFNFSNWLTQEYSDVKINELIKKNDSLLRDNAKLDSLRIIYKSEIEKSTAEINLLNKKDESLILKISSIDEKVKNLNIKYEKAANHADSFNSNDIARYFSNL